MEPTLWESLWRTYMQILGCVFVVSFMRYGEGKDTFHHFLHQPPFLCNALFDWSRAFRLYRSS